MNISRMSGMNPWMNPPFLPLKNAWISGCPFTENELPSFIVPYKPAAAKNGHEWHHTKIVDGKARCACIKGTLSVNRFSEVVLENINY